MSERRDTTLNASPLALCPSTKRETFHWPKYSLIVGTMTTTAVKASDAVGRQARADAVELARVEDERVGGRLERIRVRQHLAELHAPVPVEVALRAAEHCGQRPPEHPLGQVVEVAGLLEHLAVGELQVERHRARRILGRARAGVEDDVVDGERWRTGHDPLDTLVVRIALDPERLRPGEVGGDRGAVRPPEPVVVEAHALGATVVAVRGGAKPRREPVSKAVWRSR